MKHRSIIIAVIILLAVALVPISGTTQTDLSGSTCPEWVHDQYVAEGPDGNLYASWHPLVDLVHGCTFGHEHGSDPATVHPDWTPLFNYTASQARMTEPHHGFKVFSFRGDGLTRWGLLIHLGTSGHGRVCTQFHTLDIAVADYYYTRAADLVADVHLLGNFGAGQVWDDGTGNVARVPDATCPGNSEIVSDGLRRFANANAGGIGYEVWRTDSAYLPAVGVLFGHLHIAADDPITICEDAGCAEMVETHPSFRGIKRWMNTASNNTGALSVENPGTKATFWTDSFGVGPGKVEQYILPGNEFTAQALDTKCKDVGLPMLLCGDVNPAGTVTDPGLIGTVN